MPRAKGQGLMAKGSGGSLRGDGNVMPRAWDCSPDSAMEISAILWHVRYTSIKWKNTLYIYINNTWSTKEKKMRRPVKHFCLTLNLVLLPEATTDRNFSCVLLGNLWRCNCNLYDTPILLYFISFCQKVARHTHCCEPGVFLTIIYLGGHSTSVHWEATPFLKNVCTASHCLDGP